MGTTSPDWIDRLAFEIVGLERARGGLRPVSDAIRTAVSSEREKNEAGLQKALAGTDPTDSVAMMRACFDLYSKLLEREQMLRQLYRKWLFLATPGGTGPTPEHEINGLNEIVMGGDPNAGV